MWLPYNWLLFRGSISSAVVDGYQGLLMVNNAFRRPVLVVDLPHLPVGCPVVSQMGHPPDLRILKFYVFFWMHLCANDRSNLLVGSLTIVDVWSMIAPTYWLVLLVVGFNQLETKCQPLWKILVSQPTIANIGESCLKPPARINDQPNQS